MEIQLVNKDSKGYFRADDKGKEAGQMTFSMAGVNKMIIDHTEVNPDYKGSGIGRKLVMTAVLYARENGIKIIPLCPFAKSVFDKTIEIHDVLWNAKS
jgi:uncharacterized protein